MSSSLRFRKGNVELLEYTRSSKIYEVLSSHAPFDDWSKVTPAALQEGLEDLQESDAHVTKEIAKQKEILNHLSDPEQLYATLGEIEQWETYRAEVETAMVELRLLMEIQAYVQYEDDETVMWPLEWIIS